ncbi:CYTH and CHAD domain-containing protein [Candidatus Mycolicibacterium alkanivorans]|uniref:CYTH and CHAD domain-containing protein n=1 Tax=Candidatus Mycolicibacterium alkanivorans TaxID=2954114 RepID=A0ABS9YVW0_9MYCO|nr:CYTH and CHAD domain-containing protein [Candidatus Mycolicibacterium alkanivorans]MCI4675359.1 CYTH and CHAD domain-containing protein [Candidatus Mycolicibacterium alkanivorans]
MRSKSAGGTRFVEVERKFDVPGSTVFPSFEGISFVARVERISPQSLDAVYFDTPGQDLARHRITLRRRTGGADAGWHLKLPAGPDARTEIHAPLDDGADAAAAEVPAELVDIVLAIVRDRGLAPVARIATTRNVVKLYADDGADLAEFSDDEVSAWAINPADGSAGDEQRWHEWELELADGEVEGGDEMLARLGNRLLDAGAVPAGHGSKLAKVLADGLAPPEDLPEPPPDPVHRAVAEQVAELVEWDRAVRADVYDSVHQMRVITRKIRSLLQASEDAFGLTDDAWILDELRQLAGVLGTARDAEVLAERYQRALDSLPPELVRGPVRERLVDGANRRYQAGLRRSLAAMRSPRYFRLLDALEALVSAEPPEPAPGEEHAPLSIDSAYKRVRKAAKTAEQAVEEHKDEALHRIRKGAKRLRYVAAATGEPKVSERAKVIQTLLGDHQDSVVSRAHLSQQAEAAHAAGEDTFTYGLLYQQEDDLAHRSREQLDDALSALKRSVRKAH